MSIRIAATALGCIAAIVVPTLGRAATIVLTYQGYVRDGFDSAAIFGPGPTDLADELYTAVVTIDDSKGTSVYNPPIGSEISGGHSSGTLSPVSAAITIRGVTQTILGTNFGDASQTDYPGAHALWQEVSDSDADQYSLLQVYLFSAVNDFLPSWDYHFPASRVPRTGDSAFLYLTFWQGGHAALDADLTVRSLVVEGMPADVPEPGVWALMICGFGLAGGALRRRRAMAV